MPLCDGGTRRAIVYGVCRTMTAELLCDGGTCSASVHTVCVQNHGFRVVV